MIKQSDKLASVVAARSNQLAATFRKTEGLTLMFEGSKRMSRLCFSAM
jgi:hypothetical protein